MEYAGLIDSACLTNTLAPPASYLFFGLINSLIASQCTLGPEGRYPPDYASTLQDGDEFDFIIVGAGSAGSIVANRLSQETNWKILLLEAGDYPSAISEIPGLVFTLQKTSEDWQYKMEPSETSCLGLKDKVCLCPRGKALGGSSTINAMMYVRGNSRDYDDWANAGNVGWDYKSVIKHFKKFENSQEIDDTHHGKNGELEITQYTFEQPIRKILEDGYKELGLYKKYEEEHPLGFWDSFVTISDGTRMSTAKSFLAKIKDRTNLHVALNAQVGKLLIDNQNKVVQGVEVKINDKTLKIRAKNEVILSAGTINSPQILMNSGIGPKEHLENVGLNVIEDLKVGENLQDHNIMPLFANIDKEIINPANFIHETYEFMMNRKGLLSQVGVINFMGFINSKDDSKFPNLQLINSFVFADDQFSLPIFLSGFNLPDSLINIIVENNKLNANLLSTPVLLKPKSVGKILLRNTDPYEKPMIFPNYFSDENNEDLEVLLEGIRVYRNLLETETLKKYNASFMEFTLPNCQQFSFNTDDFWRCAIRNIGSHLFHPVGTCKMGPETDPSAVVDPRLRVHGIRGVRIIDGSIMPTITSGNTNAPIIMIGEKGAELIKEDWLEGTHDEL